jgi:hypothetical protein
VAREQSKKLPIGTTVRYQSMDTFRQRLLMQPSDDMDSSSSISERDHHVDDEMQNIIEEGSDAESSFDSFQNWLEDESFSSVYAYDSSDKDEPSGLKFGFQHSPKVMGWPSCLTCVDYTYWLFHQSHPSQIDFESPPTSTCVECDTT